MWLPMKPAPPATKTRICRHRSLSRAAAKMATGGRRLPGAAGKTGPSPIRPLPRPALTFPYAETFLSVEPPNGGILSVCVDACAREVYHWLVFRFLVTG